jgi:hypothetical protein
MFGAMREAMAGADLKWDGAIASAPSHRGRMPLPVASASAQIVAPRKFLQPSRRTFFGVFAVGTALSAALAASVVLTVFTHDQEQTIANEVASAHIRSLQPGHLMGRDFDYLRRAATRAAAPSFSAKQRSWRANTPHLLSPNLRVWR